MDDHFTYMPLGPWGVWLNRLVVCFITFLALFIMAAKLWIWPTAEPQADTGGLLVLLGISVFLVAMGLRSVSAITVSGKTLRFQLAFGTWSVAVDKLVCVRGSITWEGVLTLASLSFVVPAPFYTLPYMRLRISGRRSGDPYMTQLYRLLVFLTEHTQDCDLAGWPVRPLETGGILEVRTEKDGARSFAWPRALLLREFIPSGAIALVFVCFPAFSLALVSNANGISWAAALVRIPVLTALLVGLELFVALWWGPMLWTQLRVTVGTELEIRVLVRTMRISWHSVTALTGGSSPPGCCSTQVAAVTCGWTT